MTWTTWRVESWHWATDTRECWRLSSYIDAWRLKRALDNDPAYRCVVWAKEGQSR
jgi:hypothetical protein